MIARKPPPSPSPARRACLLMGARRPGRTTPPVRKGFNRQSIGARKTPQQGSIVRTDLEHLPDVKRRELECVVQILFEEFEDAYVKARYSKHSRISDEELTWLGARVEALGAAVHEVCSERLEALKGKVG